MRKQLWCPVEQRANFRCVSSDRNNLIPVLTDLRPLRADFGARRSDSLTWNISSFEQFWAQITISDFSGQCLIKIRIIFLFYTLFRTAVQNNFWDIFILWIWLQGGSWIQRGWFVFRKCWTGAWGAPGKARRPGTNHRSKKMLKTPDLKKKSFLLH